MIKGYKTKMRSGYSAIFFIAILSCAACNKMDSTYRDFVVPGGITYPGKVVSLVAHPGRNRVKITWMKGSDPTITKAKIFWNGDADSTEIKISADADTISTIIDNLPEGPYDFFVTSYDSRGNFSIPVEVLCTVYGDKYQAALLSRPVLSSVYLNDTLTIQWADVDISDGAFKTAVQYTDTLGKTKVRYFGVGDPSSSIADYKPGTTYQDRTLFLPDSLSIDTFYTDLTTQHVSVKIDKSHWIATADSYEATAALPNGPPGNTIDDDPNTFWHTDYSVAPAPGYPHWLAVNLNRTIVLTGIALTSRFDYYKEDFTSFILQGSMDGVHWTDYGTYTMPDKTGPQTFDLSPAPTLKYIRIYMTGGPYFFTHLAEFSAYGYQ